MNFSRILIAAGLVFLLAACGSQNLSDEKSRSPEQFKELQARLEHVQAAR